MQHSHRAALNGLQLDEVDNRILTLGVNEESGRDTINASAFSTGGSRVSNQSRESLEVGIEFAIRARKREMAVREEVFEKVISWAANGGWLTLGHKPGRHVRVILGQAPGIGDPWDWTESYTLLFRAYGVPYWQEEYPVVITRRNVSSATFSLGVAGSARTDCEVSFQNVSGSTVNTIAVNTGESAMRFTGLAIANGETFEMDHEDTGKGRWLRIRIKSAGGVYRSAFSCRTEDSDDELYVSPGTHEVTITAGGEGHIQLKCAGRFA